jgi:hypothetical protein
MAEARTGAGGRGGRGAGTRRPSAASGARRSARSDGPTAAGPESASAEADSGASPRAASGHVCPVAFCPVGMALSFAEAARPEVVQHLLAAGQELMLAVKAMIDARAEAVAGSAGLEHIRIQ